MIFDYLYRDILQRLTIVQTKPSPKQIRNSNQANFLQKRRDVKHKPFQKHLGLVLIPLFMLFSFSRCQDINEAEPINNQNEATTTFTSDIKGDSSRAADASWHPNDAIGVFMKKPGQALSGEHVVAANRMYILKSTASGVFIPTSSAQDIQMADGEKGDFIAYYPYTAEISADHKALIKLSDQSNQPAIDWLYSDELKNVGKTDPKHLSFRHILSKLVFNVKAEEGVSLDGLKVEMHGMNTKASLNLADGSISPDESSNSPFQGRVDASSTPIKAEFLLLPTAKNGEQFVRFILASGQTYDWVVRKSNKPFEAGVRYTYNVTIKKSTVIGELSDYFEMPTITMHPSTQVVRHMHPQNPSMRNYAMLFDQANRVALWVAYPLVADYVGSGRYDKWEYDPQIEQAHQATLYSSYNGGYSRGHQIPSGDRNASKELNWTTFYFSNMTPQLQSLNGGVWAQLENKGRTWMKNCDTLYIVTGPILTTPQQPNIVYTTDKTGKQVAVPAAYYKAFVQKRGDKYYTAGFRFDHKTPPSGDSYSNHRTTVKALEQETGYTFFPALDDETKSQTSTTFWQ